MEGRFFRNGSGGALQCLLCPNACRIAPGLFGTCQVRTNDSGRITLPYYGKLSAVSMDPIEKKPLYHYYPGQQILSVGFVGCSFHCPFCQNYRISQSTQGAVYQMEPKELVDMARRRGSFAVAYTYSEPIVHLEYVLDTAHLARKSGLKNVLVSNGYINPGPAEELLDVIDAANIDMKSFDSEFYRREIGGNLSSVMAFISRASEKIHLEVTTLVIPTKNDSIDEIEAMARFLSNLDPSIPYHLSCYYPTYLYTIPPTDPDAIAGLVSAAGRHLFYVYAGNVGSESGDTLCPKCSNVLIRRKGHRIRITGIDSGRCTGCGDTVPIAGPD